MTKVPSEDEAPARTQSRKPVALPLATRKAAAESAPLQLWRLQRVVAYIEAHLADHVTLLELADAAGFSPMHFAGQFRTATGMRPHDYVLRRKIEEAQLLLLTSDMPIVEVALSFGFLSQAHFTTVFKRFVGTPPLHWQHIRRPLPGATSDLQGSASEWSGRAGERDEQAKRTFAGCRPV